MQEKLGAEEAKLNDLNGQSQSIKDILQETGTLHPFVCVSIVLLYYARPREGNAVWAVAVTLVRQFHMCVGV